MIINGHSHDYERSYLLKSYYKAAAANPNLSEVDFNASLHTASQSSAKYDNTASSCPYTYNSGKFNHGTVYVVAGSSGADGGVQSGYPHNAFPFSQDDGGMLYFEIDNNRLDAKFIRRDGNIADKFTILKDVNKTTTVNTTVGVPVTLSASWPGNYSWNTSATTSSINVTPSSVGSVNYTVTDNFNCVTDNFTVVSAATLPVKLNSFTLKENRSGVLVSWATANESRNKEYRVERSSDGVSFTLLGTIAAKGSQQQQNDYSYQDLNPAAGINYYRITQVDVDGNSHILETKKINIKEAKDFWVSIIPAADKQMVLRIVSTYESDVSVRILTHDGKVASKKNYTKMKGTVTEQFTLQPGIYFSEISNQKGVKIVKQSIVH